MAIKQREANYRALSMAATILENSDFEQIFADFGGDTHEDDEKLEKAQAYAVRRIRALLPKGWVES